MIKTIKTKNEIVEGCPHRILTMDFDLEDMRQLAKESSPDDFYKKVGERICKNFDLLLKFKG